jgi:hypothetical protein
VDAEDATGAGGGAAAGGGGVASCCEAGGGAPRTPEAAAAAAVLPSRTICSSLAFIDVSSLHRSSCAASNRVHRVP